MGNMLRGNSMAVAGAAIGLAALPLDWLTLKTSRIAAGSGLGLWDSLGWGAVVILALWLACLVISLLRRNVIHSLLLGVCANTILVTLFLLIGPSATNTLSGAGQFARVSPGVGFWVGTVAAYIVIVAARQGLAGKTLLRAAISWAGLAFVFILLFSGWLNSLSVVQEYLAERERFNAELLQHIRLFAGSVAVGLVLAVPLGIWAVRQRRAEVPIFFIANITQTVPSLALFGLLIAPLSALSFAYPGLRELGIKGIGATPALIALVLYAMLPIIANTCAGLRQVDGAAIDAGVGMGMSRRQVFRRIEAPLAAPLVLEGARTASVQAVGNATVAALIGAGGLGSFVFEGLGQAAPDLILLGVFPAIGLAVAVDAVMRGAVKLATPRGIRAGAI